MMELTSVLAVAALAAPVADKVEAPDGLAQTVPVENVTQIAGGTPRWPPHVLVVNSSAWPPIIFRA